MAGTGSHGKAQSRKNGGPGKTSRFSLDPRGPGWRAWFDFGIGYWNRTHARPIDRGFNTANHRSCRSAQPAIRDRPRPASRSRGRASFSGGVGQFIASIDDPPARSSPFGGDDNGGYKKGRERISAPASMRKTNGHTWLRHRRPHRPSRRVVLPRWRTSSGPILPCCRFSRATPPPVFFVFYRGCPEHLLTT